MAVVRSAIQLRKSHYYVLVSGKLKVDMEIWQHQKAKDRIRGPE